MSKDKEKGQQIFKDPEEVSCKFLTSVPAMATSLSHLRCYGLPSHKCPRRDELKKCLGVSKRKPQWGVDNDLSDNDRKYHFCTGQSLTVLVLTVQSPTLSLSHSPSTPTVILDSGLVCSVVSHNILHHIHNI